MKNFIYRAIAIVFVFVMLFGVIAPMSTLTTYAASDEYSVSASITDVSVDTSKNFYTVKSKAVLRSSTGWLYSKLATFDKSSLVQVSGSSGDYYKVSLKMNGEKVTGFVKKTELKDAGKTTKATLAYAVKKAALRNAPYEEGDKSTVSKGSVLYVVGSLTNKHDNTWICIYKDGNIYYIYSDNIKKVNKITMTLSGSSLLTEGKDEQFKCSVSPAGVSGVKWYSSKSEIAKVNNSGVVSPKAGGNVTITASLPGILSVELNTDVILNVKTVFQSKNYTCSAAAALAVLRYKGKATNVKDTELYSSIDGYVYKIVNVLNSKKYLGSGAYCWNTFTSIASYEKAIRNSLLQNSPVIARVSFPEKYYNYGTKGHYTTIIGMYEKDGETWIVCSDSYVNRYQSNSYSNKETGIVHVPLSEMYWYNSYQGKDSRYLIYHQ